MGNENQQITFPIQNNNQCNKMKISNKKIKAKGEILKQTEQKIKIQKNPKMIKGYVIPRISATPDRNINIPGINKDNINNKRYGSYEKNLKSNSNNNIKNKDNNIKTLLNYRDIGNNKTILYISNLLNSIYSYGINNELSHINIGTKNINFNNTIKNKKKLKKDEINIMFDATFKYNYFYNNYNFNKISRKRNNSKNRYNSPRLYDSKYQSNDTEMNSLKKNSINQNLNNIKVNENINKNNINPNTTLILNQLNIDSEIISVNNKKKNYNNYNYINQNTNLNQKKYSESKFITDSESGFVSSEEISLLNNIKVEKKINEEDASESQTDKQEIINQNLTNKNKINNKYFVDSILNKKQNNNIIFKNNELNVISNINNFQYTSNQFNETNNMNNNNYARQKNNNKNNVYLNNKNNIICTYENITNSKQKNNDDEIILMNNESNKYDDNTTYMEILLAMNEKKPEEKNILNTLNTRAKKIPKDKNMTKKKTYDNEKKLLNSNIPIKREITPKNMGNKTPKNNNANKIILKNKKITPLKKIPINGNIFGNELNNFSAKKPEKKSINKSNKNNIYMNNENNLSPKKLERKSINKSNNISPMNSVGNSYINIKNKKNSHTPSPSNSPVPSPLNHFNNNYKDRYTYKKKSQINSSLKKNKKVNDNINNINNSTYRNSITSNNLTNGNNNGNKNSYIYYKINTTNNNTNNTNTYINNSKRAIRCSGNKNKIIYFKKERLSGNSFNKKENIENINEIIEVEQRTKSNDQKYSIYNSKTVLSSTKKKQK